MPPTTDWLDSPQVRLTRALYLRDHAVDIFDDPVLFLKALAHVADEIWPNLVDPYLKERGLTLDEFLSLTTGTEPGATSWSRSSVRVLFLKGVSTQDMALFFDAEPEDIEAYIQGVRMREEGPAVVELHRAGRSPHQISNELGVPRTTVYDILEDLNLVPHVINRKVSDRVRNKIIELRRAGADYPELRKRTGASTDQIRNILRAASKRGQLPHYGKGPL